MGLVAHRPNVRSRSNFKWNLFSTIPTKIQVLQICTTRRCSGIGSREYGNIVCWSHYYYSTNNIPVLVIIDSENMALFVVAITDQMLQVTPSSFQLQTLTHGAAIITSLSLGLDIPNCEFLENAFTRTFNLCSILYLLLHDLALKLLGLVSIRCGARSSITVLISKNFKGPHWYSLILNLKVALYF